MINSTLPDDWRDLQDQVAQILEECGFETEVEKRIDTARGTVDIDVFAEDPSQPPPVIYLCECKHWQSAVPKSVVHALITVISDFGANWGFIISSAGFQSGAYEAAKHSNVRLLTWREFQELFTDRWFERYMAACLAEEADPLVEYTEPINSRVFRKADALSAEAQEQFKTLREEYWQLVPFQGESDISVIASAAKQSPRSREKPIAWHKWGLLRRSAPRNDMHHNHTEKVLALLARPMYVPGIEGYHRLQLPLCKTLNERLLVGGGIPKDVLEATALREFLKLYLRHVQKGIAAFDQIFGERA